MFCKMKKCFTPVMELSVTEVVSDAKIRFAQWYIKIKAQEEESWEKTKPEQSNLYCSPSS